jgi:chromosome segregation ATPase
MGCVSGAKVKLGANPIRKVVTLMQNMQKEVEGELKTEKELYDKFMCFCDGSGAEMATSIETGKAKIEELTAKGKEEAATKVQLEQEVADHKTDRENAKADLAEATSLRSKEATEYAALKADADTNIKGLSAAIPAIEKGMGGAAFLQTPFGNRVAKLVQSGDLDPVDRRSIESFLQEGENAEGSGEILGIMKQMLETMEANLKDATAQEDSAVSGFAELEASKKKEIEVATEAIESKTLRSGELAVSIVQTKDELEDTIEEVANNEKMQSELKEQCATKAKEFAGIQKEKTDEITAISEAIGILNDDDALDVFKKAMPSSFAQQTPAFLQKSRHIASKPLRAQAVLSTLMRRHSEHQNQLNLMLYTMQSKIRLAGKHGHKMQKFDEITKMIDDMVTLLGKEQKDDDKQKEFCRDEFDKAADEETAAKEKIAAITAQIEEQTDTIAQLTEEIGTLEEGLKTLDKSVVVATEQRKTEHEEYIAAAQMNQAAVELVGKAKDRLKKFYGGAALLQQEGQQATAGNGILFQAAGFAQVRAHARARDEMEVDEDDTETQTATQKKEGGVTAMMDQIIHELEMDMKDSEYAEKTAADDYAKLMTESQETRAQDQKSITDKSAAKADLEAKLVEAKDEGAKADDEMAIVTKAIADLHASCDFLIQNYDLRKEARTNEIDALKNAKAMLAGAVM